MHVHLPKPMHGWREFAGEVGIIVIGVLIALGAEQVIESLRWQREAHEAIASLKDEIADHYFSGSEAMIAAPCIDRQLALLEQRLTKPGSYAPAPMYSESSIDYTFRAPDRLWSDDVWRSIVSEGVASHLPADIRLSLAAYYSQVAGARTNNAETQILNYRLRVLAQPLQPDVATRARLIEEIEEARGRFKEAALYSSQMLRNSEEIKLNPSQQYLNERLARSGTIKFCRAHQLPLGNNRAVF